MKITFISDTHNHQDGMKQLPGGDILIFSGDMMGSGYRHTEVIDFVKWISGQDYRYKVCVAGNHDRLCESEPDSVRKKFLKHYDDGVRYLCDELIEIEGLKIYGTPYQPYFCNWAFNVLDSNKLKEIYAKIPEDLDILITHNPPYAILDRSHKERLFYGFTGEEPLGSQELSDRISELGDHAPKYHCFGHIHGDGGKLQKVENTTYINASVCDEGYEPVNDIITIEI